MSEFLLRVEDEAADLRRFVRVAIGSGALDVVGVAGDGEAAVDMAREEQPKVVVLDLDALEDEDDVVGRVRDAAPKTTVVVVSGRDDPVVTVPAALDSGAHGYIGRSVGAGRLVEEIVRLATVSSGEVATKFDAAPASAGQARRVATAAMRQWGAGELEDVVNLLVSELVANAVRHTNSDIEVVVLRLAESVRVEVHDRSSAVPEARVAGPDAESGRGMALVESLASRWGVDARPDGKSVWFEVPRAHAS
jgi:DNA-binding NarL/FixJ family response regulator